MKNYKEEISKADMILTCILFMILTYTLVVGSVFEFGIMLVMVSLQLLHNKVNMISGALKKASQGDS